jgi:hypothetical protein
MGKSPYVSRIRDINAPGAVYQVTVDGNDVTDWIEGDITIDEQEDFIRLATFTLHGEDFVNLTSRFRKVTIWGGSHDPQNQRYLFAGVIKKIHPRFAEDGVPRAEITAYGGSWRGARFTRKIVYPSVDCPREWARKSPIKLSTIVRNILDENFYQMPVTINIKQDREFTFKKPFTQAATDWVALRELARLSNCMLLELANDTDTTEHKILFVDREDRLHNVEDKQYPIAIRYTPREKQNYDFLIDEAKEGELLTHFIDFNMDVDLNSGSLRIVSDFSEGPDAQLKITKYDEKTNELFLYELKPESEFRRLGDATVDRFWRRLTYEWDEVTEEEILPFFNKNALSSNIVPGYDDSGVGLTGAGKLGWLGYEIAATIEAGDVNIEPYRYYPLYGIGKYSTRDNGSNKYYMRSMKHILGATYSQVLNFYR